MLRREVRGGRCGWRQGDDRELPQRPAWPCPCVHGRPAPTLLALALLPAARAIPICVNEARRDDDVVDNRQRRRTDLHGLAKRRPCTPSSSMHEQVATSHRHRPSRPRSPAPPRSTPRSPRSPRRSRTRPRTARPRTRTRRRRPPRRRQTAAPRPRGRAASSTAAWAGVEGAVRPTARASLSTVGRQGARPAARAGAVQATDIGWVRSAACRTGTVRSNPTRTRMSKRPCVGAAGARAGRAGTGGASADGWGWAGKRTDRLVVGRPATSAVAGGARPCSAWCRPSCEG